MVIMEFLLKVWAPFDSLIGPHNLLAVVHIVATDTVVAFNPDNLDLIHKLAAEVPLIQHKPELTYIAAITAAFTYLVATKPFLFIYFFKILF